MNKRNLIFFFLNSLILIFILLTTNKLYSFLSSNEIDDITYDHEYSISYEFDRFNTDSFFFKTSLDHKKNRNEFYLACKNEVKKASEFHEHINCDPYGLAYGPIRSSELIENYLINIFFGNLTEYLDSREDVNLHFSDKNKVIFYTYGSEIEQNFLNEIILTSYNNLNSEINIINIHREYISDYIDPDILKNNYKKIVDFSENFKINKTDDKINSVMEVISISKISFPTDISSLKVKEKFKNFNIDRFTFLFFITIAYIFLVFILRITKLN